MPFTSLLFFANCRSGFFCFFYYCCFLQCKHIKQNHETFYVEQKKRFLVVASDCIACYCYIGFICFAFVYIRFMCVCAYVGCIVITIVYKKKFFFLNRVFGKKERFSVTLLFYLFLLLHRLCVIVVFIFPLFKFQMI